MIRKEILYVLTVFILIACSKQDSSTEDGKQLVTEVQIELSVDSDNVITSDEITIGIKGDVAISVLEVFMDNDLIFKFNAPPYTLTIDPKDYKDGAHSFKVDAYSDGKRIGTKTISVKIDNEGPVLVLDQISENEFICGQILLQPMITDLASSVERLQVYFDDVVLLDEQNTTDFSFLLDPATLAGGKGNLKFIMEDASGNISIDSIAVTMGKPFFKINFPNDFMRKDVEKVHVIISDKEGNYLDSKTHASGEMETLTFCSPEELDPDTEFTISFIQDFEDTIFDFYIYNNLTLNMLGDEITLNPKSGGLSPAILHIQVPFFEQGYQMRALGPWNSLVYTNGELTGHVSREFSNDLATNKTFISYFEPNNLDSYQWAFITDLQNRTSLAQGNFSNDNVVIHRFDLDQAYQNTLVKITGYENEAMYRSRNGHLLFADYLQPGGSTTNEYVFPDIFEYTTFWGQLYNYTFEGSGTIPANIKLPYASVDYSFIDQKLSFTGLPNYEVGRLRLVGTSSGMGSLTPENPSVTMEFIFDGQNTNPVIPKIPEGLFSEAITTMFANKSFEIVQGAAENYSAFTSYQEYIQNVLVPSVPFYVASPFKERVFKSKGPQWLPAHEFPF